MARDEGVGAVTLDCALSRLDHDDGTHLVALLVGCSMVQFGRYVKICSIDRSCALEDQLLGEDAFITEMFESLPEWSLPEKNEFKATLDQYWNTKTSDTPTTDALEKLEHSPEDLVEEAASSSPDVFEPADPKLRELIYNLPSELLLLIQEDFFDLVFGPGRIYPRKEHLNVEFFEALDQQLLAKYQRIFFCENIWVIGQGDRDDGIGFLDHMPRVFLDSIRKVEMSFTSDDNLNSSLDSYFAQLTGNALGILQSYRQVWDHHASELKTIWWEKFYGVAFLRLDYCIPDFTNACAPDGEYLGVQIARLLTPFCYGLPAEFFIKAPT